MRPAPLFVVGGCRTQTNRRIPLGLLLLLVKDLILHCEVRTPREIENEVGLTEGNIFMGELTFDQLLFNRPFPGYAQYRGPVKGMYMCSSGTHPGGGVMAAPGANAAREILIDLKRTNTVPEGYDDD